MQRMLSNLCTSHLLSKTSKALALVAHETLRQNLSVIFSWREMGAAFITIELSILWMWRLFFFFFFTFGLLKTTFLEILLLVPALL